jgi:dihydrofolate reductase
MSKLRCHISISLDGFVAGPNQSEENPLGEGGERLHDWVVPLASWRRSHGEQGGEVNQSTPVLEESRQNIGAGVMGRNMFGPVRGGAWGDEQWTGWWGDNPPYHYPVFVLTHHPRDPVEMEGGRDHVPLRHRRNPARARAGKEGRRRPGRHAVGRRPCRSAVPGSGTAGRARAARRSGVSRWRFPPPRQSRGRGCATRAGPGRRGARRHPPQVPDLAGRSIMIGVAPQQRESCVAGACHWRMGAVCWARGDFWPLSAASPVSSA